MEIRLKTVKRWIIILSGVTIPLWLPLLEGYLFRVYWFLIERPLRSTVELTNVIVVIFSFVAGNISLIICCDKSSSHYTFMLLVYLLFSIPILFITGWEALMIAGFGA